MGEGPELARRLRVIQPATGKRKETRHSRAGGSPVIERKMDSRFHGNDGLRGSLTIHAYRRQCSRSLSLSAAGWASLALRTARYSFSSSSALRMSASYFIRVENVSATSRSSRFLMLSIVSAFTHVTA